MLPLRNVIDNYLERLASVGSIEADGAEAQYVGVVVTEPLPKKKKKSTGQRFMIEVILALDAVAITVVPIFIMRSSGDSDKAPSSCPANGPNSIVPDNSLGEMCAFLKLQKVQMINQKSRCTTNRSTITTRTKCRSTTTKRQ